MNHSANCPDLAPEPGTYVLVVALDRPATISVGRLGSFEFTPGCYLYVGSARGPGGLRARVSRHLRAGKTPHWHVDALAARAPIVEVWGYPSTDRLECRWARALMALDGVRVPVPRFGSSDCACHAHLFHLPLSALDAAWEVLARPTRISL